MAPARVDPERHAAPAGRQITARWAAVVGLAAWSALCSANAEPAASVDPAALIAERYPTVEGVVAVRGNCVAWEYYRPPANRETLQPVYSVTKSVLSILVGIAIDRGYLGLDRKLSELLPETKQTNIDPRVGDVSVRDLLTMTSGFEPTSALPRNGIPADKLRLWMIERPLINTPGAQFSYDSTSANLLAVVLARAVRQNSKMFAQSELFRPLRIRRYSWTTEYDGALIAAGSLSLTTRDMAKIGLLYLRRGLWGDRRVVSDAFVADATRKHNDGGPPVDAAYGYLWWVEANDSGPNAFLAAGMGSQLIYVAPQLDLVVAMSSAASVPGGSRAFVNTVIIPTVLARAAPRQCAPLQNL